MFAATIDLPASKSISHRALIINALCKNGGTIENLSDCDDTVVLERALQRQSGTIDVEASGTALRFLTAYLATKSGSFTLTGSPRLRQRPIAPLVDALRILGADIHYLQNDGYAPLAINGKKLHGGELTPHFDESSQFFSAIMLIAPYLSTALTLHFTQNPHSFPYIEMTAAMMRQAGAKVAIDSNKISVENRPYRRTNWTIERDWSAASYWYEWLAIAQHGQILLRHLQPSTLQGDALIATLFQDFGIETKFTAEGAEISHKSKTTPTTLQYDFGNMPDMVPTMVVTCCARGTSFHFTGVENLRLKESDRISALSAELRKCGFVLNQPTSNSLAWDGTRCPAEHAPTICAHNDHRIAMAFAPLAAKMSLHIDRPEVASKSYPNFFEQIREFLTSHS